MEQDIYRFLDEILPKAVELEKKLPQIFMRIPVTDFVEHGDKLWYDIRAKITDRYPQYRKLLFLEDLAFRVVFRPVDSNATLPGFDDVIENTRTLTYWYGMDYQPDVGEYIGMTRDVPWTYYMLPDLRFADPRNYRTLVYMYENQRDQLIKEGQSTVGPLPSNNYLTNFLRMFINISWIDTIPGQQIDPLVHDSSLEGLQDLITRVELLRD